ncbi:hypothetical protein FISHEDRAFT_18517, partial [Fistulina hepatica ATCC 64428]
RHVKWDRSLSTIVALEDIKPRPPKLKHKDPKENIAIGMPFKGCLAPTAKATVLDTMGNLSNVEPLGELVPENVIVKKYVYDNDEDA